LGREPPVPEAAGHTPRTIREHYRIFLL